MSLGFKRLNAELNPMCHLLSLLEAHHILHVSRIRVNWGAIRHLNKEQGSTELITDYRAQRPCYTRPRCIGTDRARTQMLINQSTNHPRCSNSEDSLDQHLARFQSTLTIMPSFIQISPQLGTHTCCAHSFR